MTNDAQIQHAIADLDSPDIATRTAAIQQLGRAKHQPSVSLLWKRCRQDVPEVRQAAVRALLDITGLADSTISTADRLARLIKIILQITGGERGFIALKNRSTGEMEVQAAQGFPSDQPAEDAISSEVVKRVAQTKTPVLTDNAQSDARFSEGQGIVMYGLRSVMAVPLTAGDEVIGVVYCDQRVRAGLFESDEMTLLADFAAQAAELIEEIPPAGEIREQAASETASLPPEAPAAEAPPAPPPPPVEEPQRAGPGAPPLPAPVVQRESSESHKEASNPAADIQFSTYYPREVVRDEWQPLTAYVYKAFAADQVAQDAQKQLGDLMTLMRRVGEKARQMLQEGALITATPHLPGFQFNPPSISVGFFEDWHRFDFKLRAKDAPLYQAANGFLTFTVEGVIAADLPLAIFVGESTAAVEMSTAAQKLYQAVFCSYSHQDTPIVERVERAYRALGLDYLRDIYTLKSGQHWDEQLLKMIDSADIFQLFWSPAAASSPYVEQEWRHALNLKNKVANFIRPVYWQQPIPSVPPELSPIHFAYQPDLAK